MTHFLFRPFTFRNEEKKNENNLDGYDFNGFYAHFVVVVHCVVLEPHCKWNCCKYGYDCTQSEQLCFNAIDASFFCAVSFRATDFVRMDFCQARLWSETDAKQKKSIQRFDRVQFLNTRTHTQDTSILFYWKCISSNKGQQQQITWLVRPHFVPMKNDDLKRKWHN